MHRLLALPLVSLLLIAAARAADGPAPASYASMIEAVAPAVVTVYTTKQTQGSRRMIMPFLEDNPPGQRRRPESGQGSGVVVGADGVILTNNHVIDGADRIEVQLRGARGRVAATLVGADPKTDLAVLRIDAKGLPVLAFADSDRVRVGDLAFAIGNPFGVGHSVSMGIVSATGRGGVGIVDYEDFIQTDASINPGNSGGALVDSLGRLVGINTAIYSRGGGNIGIGFAVPANLAKRVKDQLLEGGKVVRGYLGVQIGELTPELARKFGGEAGVGALVGEVLDGGPAEKAGLLAGDVIVRADGRPVADPRQLRLQIAGVAPGSTIDLSVLREGREQDVRVTVGELPGDPIVAGGGQPGEPGRLGVTLQDLTPQVRQQAQVPARIQGALITQVEDGSRAERAGLRPGMIITEVERRPVSDASATVQQLRLASGDVLLRVWFEGGNRWIVVAE
jgi:serine protease Do